MLPIDWVIIGVIVSSVLFCLIFVKYYGKHKMDRNLNNTIELAINYLNKKIKMIEENVFNTITRIEDILSELDGFKSRTDEQEDKINNLSEGVKEVLKAQVHLTKGMGMVNGKILEFSKRQEELQTEIMVLGKKLKEPTPKIEHSLKTLGREGVEIARLNQTEMEVLRLLASSGSKSASEIREVIGRTREHAGRLMKKLFLEGYVERDTTTIPFRYKLREKIKDSLEFSV